MTKPQENTENNKPENNPPPTINSGDGKAKERIQEAKTHDQPANKPHHKPSVFKRVIASVTNDKKQPLIANLVSLGMLIATVFLAVYTLQVLHQTQIQSKAASEAAIAATNSVGIASETLRADTLYSNKTLEHQRIVDKQTDSLNNIKSKHDDSVFEYQKRSFNAQIKSIETTQQQFIKENVPYIQLVPDTQKAEIHGDNIIRVFYRVQSLSKVAIETTKSFIHVFEAKDSTGVKDKIFKKYIKPINDEGYFGTTISPQYFADFIDSANIVRRAFLDGKCLLFLAERFEYKNYLNNKTRYYDFIFMIHRFNNRYGTKFILNRNYDVD